MERSLINDFKSATSSTLIHSTVLPNASHLRPSTDLSKSRFPAQPRLDLSRHLDFLVVFQAVQIERLSQQAAVLRGRAKEWQGRNLHQASYEVQIKELMDRCALLEADKYACRQELAQTKSASEAIFHELTLLQGRYSEVDFCAPEKYKLEKARGEQLSNEIQRWKGRYAALERAKGQETETLRRALEGTKGIPGSSEAKELLAQFDVEREELLARLRERKEQLDQRELEITKLQNCYEQLQVKSREEEAKVDTYEEKVAMLSQQTYRLSELLRAKTEEIRSLKMMGEQDYSLKMSHIHSLDETRLLLTDRLQAADEGNLHLRQQINALSEQNAQLRHRLVEVQRLELQLQQAKQDNDNKMKALERKDKNIIALEQEISQYKKTQDEVKRIKNTAMEVERQLRELKQRLDVKIEELRQAKQQLMGLIRWKQEFARQMEAKVNQFSQQCQFLMRQNAQMRTASQQNRERSAAAELKAKEFTLQLKEKDYRITSLQNDIKQQQARAITKEAENNEILQRLQANLFAERRTFQVRLREAEAATQKSEQYMRQAREAQGKAKEAEMRLQEYRMYEQQVRSLQAECNELDSWGRSLEQQNHQLTQHVHQLQDHIAEMQEEGMGAREALKQQAEFYRMAQLRYFQTAKELKALHARLDIIERILNTLKTTVGLRLKNATEEDGRLHLVEQRYEELFQWFISVSANMEASIKDSPSKTPYHGLFTTEPNRPTPSSSPIHRNRSPESTRQNVNSGNRSQELPLQSAIRHVLLCAEVESLRKRVGDKNAKVESMRNSIVKGHSQTHTGMYGREASAGKKTIYY